MMNNIKNYVNSNKERFISELIELLKIPSVSADSAYSQDVINTAEAVKESLEKAGCDKVKYAKHQVIRLCTEKKLLIVICRLFWFTDTTMFSHQIRWTYGILLLLNRLSKLLRSIQKVLFLPVELVMIKDKCICT